MGESSIFLERLYSPAILRQALRLYEKEGYAGVALRGDDDEPTAESDDDDNVADDFDTLCESEIDDFMLAFDPPVLPRSERPYDVVFYGARGARARVTSQFSFRVNVVYRTISDAFCPVPVHLDFAPSSVRTLEICLAACDARLRTPLEWRVRPPATHRLRTPSFYFLPRDVGLHGLTRARLPPTLGARP